MRWKQARCAAACDQREIQFSGQTILCFDVQLGQPTKLLQRLRSLSQSSTRPTCNAGVSERLAAKVDLDVIETDPSWQTLTGIERVLRQFRSVQFGLSH